jgi:3-hydroxy-3-methylglutaryl CoA synthase
MPAADRDVALKGGDDALQECVQKISSALEDCLATATDDAARAECKAHYKRGMQMCKDAHDINRATVDDVFPSQK